MDREIEALGHTIKHLSNGFKCGTCGQFWTARSRATFVQKGPCPGPGVWGTVPVRDRPLAVPFQRGEGITFKGVTLHSSHRLAWYRGIVYCKICGCYGDKKPVGLTSQCDFEGTKAPVGSTGYRNLKSIGKGEHPKGKEWPEPLDTIAPLEIANITS